MYPQYAPRKVLKLRSEKFAARFQKTGGACEWRELAGMRPIGIQGERQLSAVFQPTFSWNGSAGRDRGCVKTSFCPESNTTYGRRAWFPFHRLGSIRLAFTFSHSLDPKPTFTAFRFIEKSSESFDGDWPDYTMTKT